MLFSNDPLNIVISNITKAIFQNLDDFLASIKQDLFTLKENLYELTFLRNRCIAFNPDINKLDEKKEISIQTQPTPLFSVINEWDITSSNSDLEFSDANTTCKRPGGVSCFPAAFCPIKESLQVCNFTLKQTGSTTNWLSIGVCKEGFARSNSDGFGKSSNSWGIADDRSKEDAPAFFAYNGTKLCEAPRKLKIDDVITLICDFSRNTIEISVNYGEFTHIFGNESSSQTNSPHSVVIAKSNKANSDQKSMAITSSNDGPMSNGVTGNFLNCKNMHSDLS
jgi:hypothetical protein